MINWVLNRGFIIDNKKGRSLFLLFDFKGRSRYEFRDDRGINSVFRDDRCSCCLILRGDRVFIIND